MVKITEDFFPLREGHIFYKYIFTNSQKPTLIAIPGGPGWGFELYESRFMAFVDDANILLFDPLGCGKSSLPDNLEAYSLKNNIQDLKSLLDFLIKAFQLPHIILHGTSYGSMVAQGFATRFPEMLYALILTTGAPSYKFLDLAKKELEKRGTPRQREICERYLWPGAFNEKSAEEYAFEMSQLYCFTLQKKENIFKDHPLNIPCLNRAFKMQFDHFDFTRELKNIKCPTLILSGRHDWINPPVLGEELHHYIPNSKLVIFENSGHSLFFDEPERYKKVIRDFIVETNP